MQRIKVRLMYALGMLMPLAMVARHIERLDDDTAIALWNLFS
jgi:hypothetical protein